MEKKGLREMSNFWVRTISGAVFLAVMACGILLHPTAFGVLFLVVLYLALREFLTITMGQRWQLQQKLAIVAAVVIYLLSVACCFYSLPVRWLALGIIPLLALSVSIIMASNHDTVEDTAFLYTGILYIALPFSLAPLMVTGGGEFKGFVLFNIFLIIWCSDIGAYCIGTLLGQKPTSRKLAPTISPKKSWWGFWGGVVLAVAAAAVLHFVGWMDYPLLHCLAIGLLVSVAGVCGDLFESVWKRRFGVKDSGNVIPGHGGMLDRFDSALFAIPVAFAYLALCGLL